VAYKRAKTYLSVRKCLYRNGVWRAIWISPIHSA